MKLVRTDISNVAYAEKKIHMKSFLDLIENCEKLLFETGVYKNGPTTIETTLSTFGKPEDVLFKVFIPINIPIEGNSEFKYIKRFTIKKSMSEIIPFDDDFLPKIEEMKQYIQNEGLEIIDDILYITIMPVFGQYFVEINIPVEEV